MTEHFTETLKQASEPIWAKAVEHRFVAELFAGTGPRHRTGRIAR